ncbi:hypothetical protein [Vallitalea okinawensis]|uniref:hypothetical protein n=1 Tax=Vallitalea okinawensis TaxID=2078660 RepID=UPI000CFB93EB|nr:hypothetical protein [Vallitalea okinawensis]
MNQFFEQFDDIYENREQYNISWAFKDAQEKLNEYKEHVVDQKVKKQCSLCKKIKKGEYHSFQSKSHLEIKKQKVLSSIFSHVHGFMNFLEIILSVLLVLVISEISHGDFIVHQGAMVVIVFAFIKVFIEHYVLKPQLEAFGWQLYKNSVNVLKSLLNDISEQLVFEKTLDVA